MKINVVIELNKKDFHIEVIESDDESVKEPMKELREKFEVERQKYEAFHEAKIKFDDVNDEYNINKELLGSPDAEIPMEQRLKMLWRQKDLLLQLLPLRLDKETKAKVPVNFEGLAKDQFNLLVSGEGKEALVKEMGNIGKSYSDILNQILPKLKEEKEKK